MQTTERMLTNEHLSRSSRTVAIWGTVGSRSSETSSPHWLGRRKLLTADPFGRVMRRRERIHALASPIDEIQLPHRVDRGTLLSVPAVAVAAWQFAERFDSWTVRQLDSSTVRQLDSSTEKGPTHARATAVAPSSR